MATQVKKAVLATGIACGALLLALLCCRDLFHDEVTTKWRGSAELVTEKRLGQLRTMSYRFRDRVNRFPASGGELYRMFPSLTPGDLSDGWGRAFNFHTNGGSDGIIITSLGADGLIGGQGGDADFVLQLK
jgi:hypothetical protein